MRPVPAAILRQVIELGQGGFNSKANRTERRHGLAVAVISVLLLLISASYGGQVGAPGFLRQAPRAMPAPAVNPEFTFARVIYTGLRGWGYYKNWYTDWPKADRQFVLGIRRLTNIRVAEQTKAVSLTDQELLKFPFVYSVEVGHWDLTEEEVSALREYLARGGFLFCDDFWGTREWENFQRNIQRVLPDRKIEEIPMDHPLFHAYYDIAQVIQVPNVGNALYQRATYEEDGYEAFCRGIFDSDRRLMVVINWNTDLGDAWEWADLPGYPAKYSTYAYQVGINAIIYAMTH